MDYPNRGKGLKARDSLGACCHDLDSMDGGTLGIEFLQMINSE